MLKATSLKEDHMRNHVIVSLVLTTSCFLAPLGAAAQAISIFGADPAALACYDSAKRAVDFAGALAFSLEPCTQALEQMKLKDRDRAATRVNRGILYAALKNYSRAIQDYDAARALHPNFGAIYVNRGNIFFIKESYDSAIVEYTKALEAEMSEYQVAYLNRGMAHESLGHYPNAEADYRQALTLVPNWDLAETKLARVLGKMN